MVPEGGSLQGFRNLAAKEHGSWWKTRTWLMQVLIWGAIVNGLLAIILWVAPAQNRQEMSGAELLRVALELAFTIGAMAPAVGIVIIGQDAIIEEKQTGTAAWLLSKPISRSAFILAKFSAHALGALVTMVLIQGALAYAQITLATHQSIPVLPWLGGMGLIFVTLMFYLALTLMLGTFFDSRGPVIGIPMLLIFGYQLFLGIAPFLAKVLPYALTVSLGSTPSMAVQLVNGQPITDWMPLLFTVAWTIVFAAVAVWRFQREEF
jgi:ABC-2 type transport system permease protein